MFMQHLEADARTGCCSCFLIFFELFCGFTQWNSHVFFMLHFFESLRSLAWIKIARR